MDGTYPKPPNGEHYEQTHPTHPGVRASSCPACAGYGEHMTPDGNPDGPCTECNGAGIDALWLQIQAPQVKPVRKRKTGKMYQRNPMLNANDRDHWRVLGPIRAEWREKGELAGIAAKVADLGWTRARIDAYIHRPINNKSDAGNFYPTVKPIVDGLIDAGLLPDDNDDHLEGPFQHKGEKGPYAVTLVITRLEAQP